MDEALLDATSLVKKMKVEAGDDGVDQATILAKQLREEVKEATGCDGVPF